uniref:Uncharacterized protein n=1 Tax=Brassica oleracea var. oleracea TaxID=109376 RepID=A0A0D3AT79_BRAOL
MEFDFRGSNGLVAVSVFLVPPAFSLIRSGIGPDCFVGVGAQCRFRPIHCSLSFSGSFPVDGVVVSFLPCSVWIKRLGSLECRTDRCFGETRQFLEVRSLLLKFVLEGSAILVWIEIGSSHERIVCPRDVPIGGIRCVWVVPVASLAPVNPFGVVSVPESDPIGSTSLTLEGVVPTVWLGSLFVLRKLRSATISLEYNDVEQFPVGCFGSRVRFCCELVSVCAVSSEPVSVCAVSL